MKTLIYALLTILLSGCDMAKNEFPPPPDRILSLESPSARDTLVVNTPFSLKGNLDIDAEAVRIQVLSGSTFFLDQQLQNVQGLQPIPLNAEYTINTPTGNNTPISVNLKLSWDEENKFVEVPLYLRQD